MSRNVSRFGFRNPALLLTDGTAIVQHTDAGKCRRLTPDNTGSYINTPRAQKATLPSGYEPL
jgi:hypothetical protein